VRVRVREREREHRGSRMATTYGTCVATAWQLLANPEKLRSFVPPILTWLGCTSYTVVERRGIGCCARGTRE